MANVAGYQDSFRSITRLKLLLCAEERAFLDAGTNVEEMKAADNSFPMNQEIYRFAVNRAFTKERMEVLRYLTHPEARRNRLTEADVCELRALNDPIINENLKDVQITAEETATVAKVIHSSNRS
jgi:hypothetical protein